MCVGVVRVIPKPLLTERHRAADRLAKPRVERRVRRGAREIRSCLTKVIVNGDGALLECQRHPYGGSQKAIGVRVCRVGVNGLPEGGDRFDVVEVVAELQPARSMTCRSRRICRHPSRDGHDERGDAHAESLPHKSLSKDHA